MKFFIILACLSTNVWAISYIPPMKLLKEGGSEINLSADSFQTSKVVDYDGKSETLKDGESFSRYEGEISGLYGMAPDFNVGLGVRFRHQSSKFISGTDEVDASITGVQSIAARFLYGFNSTGKTRYALEGMFRYNPYSNDEVSAQDELDKLILGDQGNEYSLGLGMTHSTASNNHFTLRGGWRRPGDELSTEFYWNGEIAFQFRHITPLAGVNGVTSLKNSTYESDPEDRPAWNTGATALYNSINREWIAPYVGINIALSSQWLVQLRAQQVVSGRSTDLGTGFGISLVRRVDPSDQKTLDSSFKTYDIEAVVTKVSEKKSYVVLDKGFSDDIEKGMRFDFFEFDYVGGNVLIARGVVVKISSSKSIVKLTHRFNQSKEIKEGLVGRASLK